MKIKELRELSIDELKKELDASMKEVFNLRMQKATGQLNRSHVMREAKKQVAQIKTLVAQKQKSGGDHD